MALSTGLEYLDYNKVACRKLLYKREFKLSFRHKKSPDWGFFVSSFIKILLIFSNYEPVDLRLPGDGINAVQPAGIQLSVCHPSGEFFLP